MNLLLNPAARRVATLQAEYQQIHEEVLDRYRNGSMSSALEEALQTREQQIITELNRLGAPVYAEAAR